MQEMPQHATSDDRHDRGTHLRTKQLIGGRRSGSGSAKVLPAQKTPDKICSTKVRSRVICMAVLSLLTSDIDYT
jgi:hypothetical protein